MIIEWEGKKVELEKIKKNNNDCFKCFFLFKSIRCWEKYGCDNIIWIQKSKSSEGNMQSSKQIKAKIDQKQGKIKRIVKEIRAEKAETRALKMQLKALKKVW